MPAPLKVLFVAARYPAAGSPREGVFVREHARAAALFNDVTVLYAGKPAAAPRPPEREPGGKLVERPFPRPFFPFPTQAGAPFERGVRAAFRGITADGWHPDIIHAHTHHAGPAAVALSRKTGLPFVITEHLSRFSRRKMSRAEIKRASASMAEAAMILPVSHYLREAIMAYGISGRFRVIPNALDSDLFSPGPGGDQAAGGKKKMLAVGNLVALKNYPLLLAAVSRLRAKRSDFRLDIAGEGPERKNIEKIIAAGKLAPLVSLLGHRTQREVAGLMKQSAFLVHPSRTETFGCVLAESLATGKPVIAFRTGAIPEIIGPGRGILAEQQDLDGFTDALGRMLDGYHSYNPGKLREYAVQNFGHRAVGAEMTAVYEEVLGRARAGDHDRPGGKGKKLSPVNRSRFYGKRGENENKHGGFPGV